MEIRSVGPHDDAATAAWHATYEAADRYGREDLATTWGLTEVRAALTTEMDQTWRGLWSGIVDGEVVVAGQLTLSLLDNLTRAEVLVCTHPDHRRRGYGSAMLAHLEEYAARRGRRIFVAEAAYPSSSPADGAGHPHAEFLASQGYAYALGDVQRRLDLPVPDELLACLAAAAAPHHTAYTLRSWEGPAPDEIAGALAALDGSLMTEAPVGELEVEPMVRDAAALRAEEELIERQGRTKFTTVAVHADGELAAYTVLARSREDGRRAYQWGTLVAREHRGHRLGLAVKVANLVYMQGIRADAPCVVTYNAEVNEHMIGVNDELGFVPVERAGEFQKVL